MAQLRLWHGGRIDTVAAIAEKFIRVYDYHQQRQPSECDCRACDLYVIGGKNACYKEEVARLGGGRVRFLIGHDDHLHIEIREH